MSPLPTPGKFTEWRSVKAIWLAFLLSSLAHAGLLFYKNPLPDRGRLWVWRASSMTKRLSILTIGQTAHVSAKNIQSRHPKIRKQTAKIRPIQKHQRILIQSPTQRPTSNGKITSPTMRCRPAEIIANPSFPEPPANVKQGRVQIIFLVNKTGEIDSILIGENTIDPEFFDVIKNNFSKLGFRPGKINDTATNSRFTMEIDISP